MTLAPSPVCAAHVFFFMGGSESLSPHPGSWTLPRAGSDAVPSPSTPLDGLLCVGDSMFPGPGVPAVAAGGTIAAHSLVPWWKQWVALDKIGAATPTP